MSTETSPNVHPADVPLVTWLSHSIPQLEYELPCGKVATVATITSTGISFQATESFGTGKTPYADSPKTHLTYLDSPDVAQTEGSVIYERSEAQTDPTLALPKKLVFEDTITFDSPLQAASPDALAAALQSRLRAIAGLPDSLAVTAPATL